MDSAWPCGANRFTREKDSKVKHNLNKKGKRYDVLLNQHRNQSPT